MRTGRSDLSFVSGTTDGGGWDCCAPEGPRHGRYRRQDLFDDGGFGSASSNDWHFISGSFSQQHSQKGEWGLIDADASAMNDFVMCIADGVTGVQAQGIDPSQLPHELLQRIVALANQRAVDPMRFDADVHQILRGVNSSYSSESWLKDLFCYAYLECGSLGATTVCLTALENNQLVCCNLGDCQAHVLRRPYGSGGSYEIRFRTPTQRVSIARLGGTEAPKQLHHCSHDQAASHLLAQARQADVFRVAVSDGDLVILSTDGVGDNLNEGEMLGIVNTFLLSVGAWRPPLLRAVAKQVVLSAIHSGRKPDDTTAVAGIVCGPAYLQPASFSARRQPGPRGAPSRAMNPPNSIPEDRRAVYDKEDRDACNINQCVVQ